MTKSRKWAAGVYDPAVGFMVAGGWGDQTAETSSDGASFTRIGTDPSYMTFTLSKGVGGLSLCFVCQRHRGKKNVVCHLLPILVILL